MKPALLPSTLPLFAELDRLLLEVLRSASPDAWKRPTLAPNWSVHDVALHLLDGSLRSLSALRDDLFSGPGPASGAYPDVVSYLNELNNSWVRVGQRLSPSIVVWLLEMVGPAYSALLTSLDPAAPATFSVAWAGEAESTNAFHVAREYTEKWHHQQQIRQAVGQEQALLTPELYGPFLSTCVRALPHHYREVVAPQGTVVELHITGSAGRRWFIGRNATGWELGLEYDGPVDAKIELNGPVAWRLFTKSLPRVEAEVHIKRQGPEHLTTPIYSLLTVMA